MQEALVVIIVISAVSYLGWRAYLRSQKKADCGSDCGCESKPLSFNGEKDQ
ncbi:MAG: FeoB-associated Cys-rich membrane protein [Bacteroidetes bacterium]|nr:MAG: FeoB-associated Cys-rich membrane protein [Bacteroidota bacterium]